MKSSKHKKITFLQQHFQNFWRLQDICILLFIVKNNLCSKTKSNMFDIHETSYNLTRSDFLYQGLIPQLTENILSDTRGHLANYGINSAKMKDYVKHLIVSKHARGPDITELLDEAGCSGCYLCNSAIVNILIIIFFFY